MPLLSTCSGSLPPARRGAIRSDGLIFAMMFRKVVDVFLSQTQRLTLVQKFDFADVVAVVSLGWG